MVNALASEQRNVDEGNLMPIMEPEFVRDRHVYANSQFWEVLKDAMRFFHGTPVLPLPPPKSFDGAGVYAIYCVAKSGLYRTYGERLNRTAYDVPIYVGSAVPRGWRQNRVVDDGIAAGTALYSRLKQHAKSIRCGKGLDIIDFSCRFAILEGDAANMIAALEAAIIAEHTPLWNSVIDGFGNHNPGKRRVTGKRPQWDCLHPGRPWAMDMTGEVFQEADLRRRVTDYLMGIQCRR